MSKTAAHVIRITGLVIEMLGVWSVFRSYRRQGPGTPAPARRNGRALPLDHLRPRFRDLADRDNPRQRVTSRPKIEASRAG